MPPEEILRRQRAMERFRSDILYDAPPWRIGSNILNEAHRCAKRRMADPRSERCRLAAAAHASRAQLPTAASQHARHSAASADGTSRPAQARQKLLHGMLQDGFIKHDGKHHESVGKGPKHESPKHEGPKHEGPKREGPKHEGKEPKAKLGEHHNGARSMHHAQSKGSHTGAVSSDGDVKVKTTVSEGSRSAPNPGSSACDCSTRSRSPACGLGKLCEMDEPAVTKSKGTGGSGIDLGLGGSGSGGGSEIGRSAGGTRAFRQLPASTSPGAKLDVADLRRRVAMLEGELSVARQELAEKKKQQKPPA
jgi:hypothetical protein